MKLIVGFRNSGRGENNSLYWKAVVDILPLALSIMPWGVLCGSLALEAGFSSLQAQCMSLFVFAGAAQLSGTMVVGAGGGSLSLLSSTAIVSSRHLLYSATFREHVKQLPFFKRAAIAFFLTDEMFVVTEVLKNKIEKFVVHYAVASGVTLYIVWNISTFIGIYTHQVFENIESLGLEFAIATTFIAMVIPRIQSNATLVAVLVSGISATWLHYLSVGNALLISALLGMVVGHLVKKYKAYG